MITLHIIDIHFEPNNTFPHIWILHVTLFDPIGSPLIKLTLNQGNYNIERKMDLTSNILLQIDTSNTFYRNNASILRSKKHFKYIFNYTDGPFGKFLGLPLRLRLVSAHC